MASWYDIQDDFHRSGDNWFRRLIKGLNNALNPYHAWFDYDEWEKNGSKAEQYVDSFLNQQTGTDLTEAENKANAFNAEEAQKSRDFTEYMARNKYSIETASMTDAGINPAMMYGGGNLVSTASNGAQATSVSPHVGDLGNMLMSLIRMPYAIKQAKLDNEAREKELALKQKEIDLKQKDLDWYDEKAGADVANTKADTDKKIKELDEIDSKIKNNEADTQLKFANVDKAQAETAVEWAKYSQIGLSNELQEQLNPLLVEAQELENELSRVESEYREKQILARLAETRAHTAALYAQAALDGARKEGVDIENAINRPNIKFAQGNAQNRANLLRWTAFTSREELKQARYQTKNAEYYADHYEEAFRNSWSQSGVEWGVTQQFGQALGTLSMLGLMLAY